VHNVESSRIKKPRNILHILSTNTRRTKVVELSTGTHRVADELRRHSLSDGEGGHYSTNLDRNRYGSDNNYLFTVTRYNLECLGLCPCLVDIEIVDTRNGNESQLVTAGEAACSCDSPERAELADVSHFAGSNPRAAPPSPHREMRRVASAGALNGGGIGGGGGLGLRRIPSNAAMRRNPSSGRLYEYGGGNGGTGALPTHSRGSGGSDLFDALLMAATGDHDVRSHGEPPVSSHVAPGAPGGAATVGGAGGNGGGGGGGRQPRGAGPGGGVPRGVWGHGSQTDLQDSLHNAVEALNRGTGAEDDDGGGGTGGLARLGSGSAARGGGRRGTGMLRRNSVSMILDNPVLAQTGAGDSLIMGQQYYQAYMNAGGDRGGGGSDVEGEGEGDTDHGEDAGTHGEEQGGAGNTTGAGNNLGGNLRQGLLRQFRKQHSAVNLNRLGAGAAADVRRLQDELRLVREEAKALETTLEESKSAQKAAERTAEEAGTACRRAAHTIDALKTALTTAGVADPSANEPADEALRTSEQEIELLRAELLEVKADLAKLQAEKKEFELKSKNLTPHGLPRGNGLPPPSAAAAAAAAAFQMPYAMSMLPMFGMPPLNPYGGMGVNPPGAGGGGTAGTANANATTAAAAAAAAAYRPVGSMQKVASMPAMHHGMMSPPADRDAKRKAESPIPENEEGGGESPHHTNINKRFAAAEHAEKHEDHQHGVKFEGNADDKNSPNGDMMHAAADGVMNGDGHVGGDGNATTGPPAAAATSVPAVDLLPAQ